ncbi:MAG: hypothetical protein SOY88_00235 [Massilioclostridium sp.]|nr:hypothetical protein [Massilioclostridium sp.]
MTNTMTENQKQCKFIADRLEQIAEGILYHCPECGEFFNAEDEEYNTICPECGKTLDTDLLESVSMLDFFQDCYNIEYRIDSNGGYKSVELMVACGGPNIYVDTKTASVNLYWWGDSAEWRLNSEAVNTIDDSFEELWQCQQEGK